ncbi:RecG-like helicase [Paenibacillus popilliae ATCC 14706]|uniref:RecG-like helicase n=2 Tax=Paenibacillus popilliae TaxID=78057 RepID=M9L8Z8_PAEPP|nr:RecG-like helicase [Paenibacillus popilliae ATCC 14706]
MKPLVNDRSRLLHNRMRFPITACLHLMNGRMKRLFGAGSASDRLQLFRAGAASGSNRNLIEMNDREDGFLQQHRLFLRIDVERPDIFQGNA